MKGIFEQEAQPTAETAVDDIVQRRALHDAEYPLIREAARFLGVKTAWRLTLRRTKVPYFRIYDLRSTYAMRLSAGGVADEWVAQLLRQGDAKVFKKYSQMKLQMKREALQKLNRTANKSAGVLGQVG